MNVPREVEVFGSFRRHLGPRFEAAGVGLVFLPGQAFGVDFSVDCPDPLVIPAVRRGIEERVSELFGELKSSFRVQVNKITYDEVDSCARAFYLEARAAIDQVFVISNTTYEQTAEQA